MRKFTREELHAPFNGWMDAQTSGRGLAPSHLLLLQNRCKRTDKGKAQGHLCLPSPWEDEACRLSACLFLSFLKVKAAAVCKLVCASNATFKFTVAKGQTDSSKKKMACNVVVHVSAFLMLLKLLFSSLGENVQVASRDI